MTKYLLTLLAAALPLSAAITTAPRKGPEGNRFLFVVDTTTSMKRIDQWGRQTVFDLVYSGLQDRMQPGDSFGLWTFGEDVKGGVFPMQDWAPERNADAATQVTRFLKEQSSGKVSRLDTAITNVERLVKSVKDVDVIIVTSAASRFKPDDSWAVLQQSWRARVEEARKANKPIVIALAGRGGQIMQVTLTVGDEPLKLMAPPSRRVAPVANARDIRPGPVKVAREPIIIRGNSTSPRPIEAIPTKFAPPPAQSEPATPDPLLTPEPQPEPVPILNREKPIVNNDGHPQVVAAREPGKSASAPVAAAAPQAGARTLIIAGASLMLFGGILGTWIVFQARARSRTSYISRSMADKP